MTEELAVIEGIHIGNRDVGAPVLWFTARSLKYPSLQVLNWKEAEELIKESGFDDFMRLEGKPCIIETDGHISRFVRLHK